MCDLTPFRLNLLHVCNCNGLFQFAILDLNEYFLQNLGEYPVDGVNRPNDEILLLLNIFGGVALPVDERIAASEASRLRAPLLTLRDLHISERNGITAFAQLCVEEGCFEEIFLGLEFSRFARPSLLEFIISCRS